MPYRHVYRHVYRHAYRHVYIHGRPSRLYSGGQARVVVETMPVVFNDYRNDTSSEVDTNPSPPNTHLANPIFGILLLDISLDSLVRARSSCVAGVPSRR